MRQRFTTSQLTTMAVAVCAAVVLAPAAVYAAASLVNIADPSTGAKARVASAGTLNVESRAGSIANSFNAQTSRLGVGWMPLVNVTAPQRVALTELTITALGPGGTQLYRLESWILKAGHTGSCDAPNLTHFDKVFHRTIAVANGTSAQQVYNGPPFVTPTVAAGRLTCLGVVASSAPNGSESQVAGIGYRL